MKKLLYAIVFSLPPVFISCEKEDPPSFNSGDDDKNYQYSIEITDSTEFGEDVFISSAYAGTDSFPNIAFLVRVIDAPSNNSTPVQLQFEAFEGDFEIAFTKDWGGYVDTIWGSGYFDEDTLYLEYWYENADPLHNDIYHASIHSL